MSPDKTSSDDEALAKELVSSYEKIKEQVQQVIVGQDSVLEQLLIAMLARGHCLLEGVPGRMEMVARLPSGARVIVDYAHTPDALKTVLTAARPHVARRLTVVFGCGGDRDKGKRPEMGAIAAELADGVVVTDDNPRHEDAGAIRKEIAAACPACVEVAGRRDAIGVAISDLAEGDILIVAGKGHETGQIVGDDVIPFSDADIVRAFAKEAAR